MDVQRFAYPREQSGFKIVCSDCGSLSIKVADPVNAPATTSVNCGVCGAFRGSLADLHDLARQGTDLFEF
jgi:ribosomal protein S27E